MDVSGERAVLICLAVIVLVTALLFAIVQYQNYNPKSKFWNRMNLMAFINILATLNSIIPQMFYRNRNATECLAMHRLAGTSNIATLSLTRMFFLTRSNMVVTHSKTQIKIGRIMVGVWIVLSLVNVLSLDLTMTIVLLPPDNYCVAVLNQVISLVFIVSLPILFDILVNTRFVYFIAKTSNEAGKSKSEATKRLLLVTCMMSVLSMTSSIFVGLCLVGLVPLPKISYLTIIIVAEQTLSNCSMAWPAIIVRCHKNALSMTSRKPMQKNTIQSSQRLSANAGTQGKTIRSQGSNPTPSI